jgi:hypothetical protein
MTSNMPIDTIHVQLDLMNKKDSEKHIQITYSVGLTAEFLDVYIENDHGLLRTSVFHKPAAEPYILPFSSDHPRHIHINIPYDALSPEFLQHHFNRFFQLNQAVQVLTELKRGSARKPDIVAGENFLIFDLTILK